jgi:hypothetical protein
MKTVKLAGSLASGLLVVLAILPFGCTLQNSTDDEEEQLGQAQQAVGGESACATVAITSSTNGLVTGASGTFTSPNTSYNPSTGCPLQYVVEFDYPPQNGPSFGWGEALPTNQTDCENARVQASWYGYNGSSWSAEKGTNKYTGTWAAGHCFMTLASGFPTGDWSSSTITSFQKVRIAVQAWVWVSGVAVHKKVSATAFQVWP